MRLDRPVLQVALDFENLPRAIQAAKEAAAGGADWIEAGTPLIKSEGLDAVRELKRAFPDRRIVADMKIMDTGAFEVEIAAKSGADVVTILGAADDDTIADGVRGGELYGAEVMVDLLGVPDPVARARRRVLARRDRHADAGTDSVRGARRAREDVVHPDRGRRRA
jgi:3-hexulose-6-phosphate synthase / 6-phospho-3-hexuloisomerase